MVSNQNTSRSCSIDDGEHFLELIFKYGFGHFNIFVPKRCKKCIYQNLKFILLDDDSKVRLKYRNIAE
jgi:hypothetical protein